MAAIKKSEVTLDKNLAFQAEYKSLEEQVNRALMEDYLQQDYVTVNARGVSRLVRERVIKEYQAAGWKVELVPDQRDGDFFEFK